MCDVCGWEEFVERINDLLDQERYEWARATLEGIRATVRKMRHATEKQSEAVDNIEMGGIH